MGRTATASKAAASAVDTEAASSLLPKLVPGETYRELKVPPPAWSEFTLRLEGTTPLICDAFSDNAKRKLAESQSGAAKVKPGPRDPDQEAMDAAYRLADGRYGFPKLGFRKALQSAAIRATEVKGTELLAAFQIMDSNELLPLILPDGANPKPRADHVVRMGRGNLAYRAEFFPWSIDLPVRLDHEVVSLDQFIHVCYKAGMGVGIGNWRPEKKGDFGCWTVASIGEVRVLGGH